MDRAEKEHKRHQENYRKWLQSNYDSTGDYWSSDAGIAS
jgi:hypothetical protein